MATANERLQDAEFSHQIGIARYSNDVVRRMIALLNRVDADLFAQLVAALDRLGPDSFTVERLEQLLASTRALNAAAFEQVRRQMPGELRALVEYEAGYQFQLFESTIPAQVLVNVSIARVSVDQVYTAAMSRPFQGTLLKEALDGIEAARAKQIRDAARIGYVENQTIDQIVRRIRGTRAAGYADGLMEASRRQIEAIVRTSISHMAGVTRDAFMEANEDLVTAVVWTATLDGRTSPPCRLRDGRRYSVPDHKPIGHTYPWGAGPGRFHWNCRSTSVGVLKSWRELGIDVDEVEPGTRASMNGQVPADLTYAQWLKNQPAAVQDDVLGATRGALFRSGGLELDRFYNDKGRYLTIEELRQRDSAAFARAGV